MSCGGKGSRVPIISVIQIGDIHFPENRTRSIGDVKDEAIAPRIVEHASPKVLFKVFSHIAKTIEQHTAYGVLICGDLTTKGDLDAYRQCVNYLKTSLRLDLADVNCWHVVPGNHDVARKTLQPGQSPFPALFTPLATVWTELFGRNPLAIDHVRVSDIATAPESITLFSLNSCVGCGEWRKLSPSLRGSLQPAISDLVSAEADEARRFALVAEQLDSPVFTDQDITSLCDQVKSLPANRIPIILAHHNLLPQATVRADIYTELLNGGALRSRLARINRPIVYCHGHIDDDPMECIDFIGFPASRIISVSAPQASEGYNVLRFHFSTNGLPLGMEIVKCRLRNHGDVESEPALRVPFVVPSSAKYHPNEAFSRIINACQSKREPIRDVHRRLDAPKPQTANLAAILREAEWYGLVELQNRDATDPYDLRVERTVP